MRQLCKRARVHYCDLLGHPIEAVARVSGMAARMTPGARHALDDRYFQRMEAIEFAVKFDDGLGGQALYKADIVLVACRGRRRRRFRSTSATSATRRRTCRSSRGSSRRASCSRSTGRRSSGSRSRRRGSRRSAGCACGRCAARTGSTRISSRSTRSSRRRRRSSAASAARSSTCPELLDRGDGAPDHPARRAAPRGVGVVECGDAVNTAAAAGSGSGRCRCGGGRPGGLRLGGGVLIFYVPLTPIWIASARRLGRRAAGARSPSFVSALDELKQRLAEVWDLRLTTWLLQWDQEILMLAWRRGGARRAARDARAHGPRARHRRRGGSAAGAAPGHGGAARLRLG